MKKDITYVGLDDSKHFIVAGTLGPKDKEPHLRRIPNEPRSIRRLFERLKRQGPVVACYEAGPSGYDLYRQIAALGVSCQVMAPSLTPRRPGERVKTDRRDAAKLVRLLRAGELTPVHVPDEAQEAVRDLVRCREDIGKDLMRWRHRLVKFLARHGRVYREGRNWSQRHWRWLRTQRFEDPVLRRSFEEYLFAVQQALARRGEMDREIQALAQREPYRQRVAWLRCFRGFDTLSATTLLAEVVDFGRFASPPELMAYLGLVPSEDSSAGRERRGSLTKAGNTHARRILVEAAWHYRHPPRIGKGLAERLRGQPPDIVAHALKAQRRLHRRYRRLLGRGKRAPVAVAAVARELVGFVWAVMTRAQLSAEAA